jgi:hypothetical protein
MNDFEEDETTADDIWDWAKEKCFSFHYRRWYNNSWSVRSYPIIFKRELRG